MTLPLLKPILLYVLVTATINSFNVFTQVYVMTLGSQASPGQALRVLVFDIWQNGFQFRKMGYGSAEAMALTFLVFAGYGVFAASVRRHVISRPSVLAWMRRSFAAAFAGLGIKLALSER